MTFATRGHARSILARMWRWIVLFASGCSAGIGFGGATSSSPKPAPQLGGGQFRVSTGLGIGFPYATAQLLLEARHIGDVTFNHDKERGTDRGSVVALTVGGQLALTYPVKRDDDRGTSAGIGVLGRALYSGGDDDASGVTVSERGLGIGIVTAGYKNLDVGPGTIAIYYTQTRVTDALGATGRSSGIEMLLVVPLEPMFHDFDEWYARLR